ncbi:MAG: methyltransferase domain-containing protein [Pirellulaceae bacterium]|nr:methyltransferase domain-containing protein [Pirellulaceae bacterium]MDP7020402.1 methyltransferase domain-containing protein [Pirellulaceae bacterium]
MTTRINLGCGRRTHPAWLNLDLVAHNTDVTVHDLRRGIPVPANGCDVVYHSHVLEHMAPEDAQRLLVECHRALRPGGVLRIAVPDLEALARAYIDALERAVETGETADADWMRVELLDQMVRTRSGGRMRELALDSSLPNESFVAGRIGEEFSMGPGQRRRKSLSERCRPREVGRKLRKLRQLLTSFVVRALDGKSGYQAYRSGLFRQSGEIHQWMYDRVSLRGLLEQIGFHQVTVCRADESSIPDFASFELDTSQGLPRKPDSIYVEAEKPIAKSRAA